MKSHITCNPFFVQLRPAHNNSDSCHSLINASRSLFSCFIHKTDKGRKDSSSRGRRLLLKDFTTNRLHPGEEKKGKFFISKPHMFCVRTCVCPCVCVCCFVLADIRIVFGFTFKFLDQMSKLMKTRGTAKTTSQIFNFVVVHSAFNSWGKFGLYHCFSLFLYVFLLQLRHNTSKSTKKDRKTEKFCYL